MNKKMADTYYRNDLCNLLLWHLQRAGREAEKEKSNNFEESYKRRLKFQKITDWKKFRACIDLFEDTEYALISAFMYQLGDLNNKNNDFGEKNIRLYGILNAFYLQIYSIIGLATLLHYPNPKAIEKRFKNLPIYKLRGIAASHTVNFQLDPEILDNNKEMNKVTSFRIVQAYLKKSGDKIVTIDENNIEFEFSLLEALNNYMEISSDYLIKIINHSIESLVSKKNDKIEMNIRLSEITSNLVNYNEINENEKYFEKIKKRLLKDL